MKKIFLSIRTKVDSERLKYIDNALSKGVDLDNDVRGKYGNIHEVKGTTFDNVIVDETRTRAEEYFTQLRLKFVAYSRGRIDYWTVQSSDKYKLGERRWQRQSKDPFKKQIAGSHYRKFKIQPSKFINDNELLFMEGCVIKYVMRHRLKGKKKDLEKAMHYIEMIIERDYK